MAEVILMPRLSDTMTEGVIAEWHKKVGDQVKKGDLLAEVETDKATMELESYKDGTLLHIGTEKGGKLQVNDLMAIIGTKGEDISGLINKSTNAAEETKQPEKSEVKETKKEPPKKDKPAKKESSIDISKMEEVVLMPRLSDTMEEGVIAEWHKKVGDTVKKGDVLADIETDKATMELESYKNGKLLFIGAQKGEKIAVNSLLCIIGQEGKVDIEKIVAAAKEGIVKSETGNQKSEVETPKTKTTPQAKATLTTTDSQHAVTNGRLKASPLAKKLAADKGIDLGKVHGSGDGGRIIKADIDTYPQDAVHKPSAEPGIKTSVLPTFTPVEGEEGYTDIS
ncbi:MAG: E3 binding domain-containing protein, partial [Bacteroidia bacterium]|nr:E3 binding domain-containing protein [Bacteroidia bacterium]